MKRARASGKNKRQQPEQEEDDQPAEAALRDLMQGSYGGAVSADAATFLAGALKFLAVELLEASVNVAISKRKQGPRSAKSVLKVTAEDVDGAIEADAELKELLGGPAPESEP